MFYVIKEDGLVLGMFYSLYFAEIFKKELENTLDIYAEIKEIKKL